MQSGDASARKPVAAPRVWLLMGHKSGDNQQVLALAEALGWNHEIKRFAYRSSELLSNLLLGPNLLGVNHRNSSELGPPWPDLVISAGRRNEPIARWIQRQAAGQPVKLVHLGRPWAPLRRFDLVISTPQYNLPAGGNVLVNALPLHRASRDRLAAATSQWAEELAPLPRPVTALLVGGNSGPYLFDRGTAERLVALCKDHLSRLGGSLAITTSARTPREAGEFLEAAFAAPHRVFPWGSAKTGNPYFALLAEAEAIIVTGDSTSMLAEASATGKPVYIFGFGWGRFAMRPEDRGQRMPPLDHFCLWRPGRWKAFISRLALTFGPRRLTRDVRRLQENLISDGSAAWLGEPRSLGVGSRPEDALIRARDRVQGLF